MADYQWSLNACSKTKTISALAQSLNIDEQLATMLVSRGVENYEEARQYFAPSLDETHSPFLMKDMDLAVDRIRNAIENKDNILIFGDYDVDGTTAVSLVYSFLSKHYPNCHYYIPDRYKEGYGVSYAGIDFAADNSFSLIISLDCGIKSIAHVVYAKEKGIDFIICDHHLPGENLPEAVAVLDPKRSDCKYPYKELSGCGVGFKLMQALCIELNFDINLLFQYLDLLSISIAADIVPITGENRIFAFFGVKQINEGANRAGIQALMKIAGFIGEDGQLKAKLTISNLVFGFAPRINAAGRLAHATAAVELLLAQNIEEAWDKAKIVNEHNTNRKTLDSQITEEAIQQIETDEFLKNASSSVLFNPDWNKGVVGIVASRCIEKYYRPTIVLTQSDDKAVGSARSVHDFDIHHAIEECSDLLLQFGGHHHAAGLTLKLENVIPFREKFEKVVNKYIQSHQKKPIITIDAQLNPTNINEKFYRITQRMQPFGPGNMQPNFAMNQMICHLPPRLLKEEHIKISIKQMGSNLVFDAIGFRMKEHFEWLQAFYEQKLPFSICFQLEENTFNNKTSLQFLIKDLKPFGYNPKTKGESTELLACNYLKTKGYEIIVQNFKSENGEIDIITKKENKLHFIEVKFRSSTEFGFPEIMVNESKKTKIKATANDYILEKDWNGDIRFEILALNLNQNKLEIEHFEDAFY